MVLELWWYEDVEHIRREEPALAGENGDGDVVHSSNLIHMTRDLEPVLARHGIEFARLVQLDNGDIAALLHGYRRHLVPALSAIKCSTGGGNTKCD